MSDADDELACPYCGGPIGRTATFCMHCSTDLTEERNAADANENGVWDQAEIDPGGDPGDDHAGWSSSGEGGGDIDGDRWSSGPAGDAPTADASGSRHGSDGLLDPEGLVDDTLTVVVGIAGGLVVGVAGTVVLASLAGGGIGLTFGVISWLGATAYLVRRRTVQAAVSHGGYAAAVVLLCVPFVAVSPIVDVEGGLSGRVTGFFVLLVLVALPAGLAALVGVVAGRFVPD